LHISPQSYEKTRKEQRKLSLFLCWGAFFAEFSVREHTENVMQPKNTAKII